jgi:hypothetical protein
MAFVPLFADSFDHYATAQLSLKYGNGGSAASISTVSPRTGAQCLAVTENLNGPNTKNFGQHSNLIVGHALNPGILNGATVLFEQQGANDYACYANVNADGSISMTVHYQLQPGPLIGTTPAGLLQEGQWAYIEYGLIFGQSNGACYIRVNGILQLALTGVQTVNNGQPYSDAINFSGPPGVLGSVFYYDDLYIGYSNSGTPQNDFLGAIRIYPYIPVANKTPLDWTPNANTNYQQVSNIPPNPASYVSDDNVGDIDQYEMQPIAGEGPVGAFNILFGQAVMCAALSEAGSGSVAPNIGGNVGTSVGPTTSFNMYTQGYVDNPVTGVPFVPSDFTGATSMGPEITG